MREKSALIISLKTLLAPYLWRTFNSLLPQTALPTLTNARLLRLGEEIVGIEPSFTCQFCHSDTALLYGRKLCNAITYTRARTHTQNTSQLF